MTHATTVLTLLMLYSQSPNKPVDVDAIGKLESALIRIDKTIDAKDKLRVQYE